MHSNGKKQRRQNDSRKGKQQNLLKIPLKLKQIAVESRLKNQNRNEDIEKLLSLNLTQKLHSLVHNTPSLKHSHN